MHEPVSGGLVGFERAAAREQLTGSAGSDRTQHVGRDHGRQQPEPHLGEGEASALDRHGDVGACDETGASADRRPVHAGDDRLGATVDRLEGRGHRARRLLRFRSSESVAARPHPFQVGAGREGAAGAGQITTTRTVVVAATASSIASASALEQARVERVAPVGPVERQGRDRAVAGQLHVAHIRNTPKVVGSSGARDAASSPSASTLRVSSGSITPSSHSRAVEWYGLPSRS